MLISHKRKLQHKEIKNEKSIRFQKEAIKTLWEMYQ